jgi:hypothetical protein
VIDVATGERIGVNDTLTFPQGSAIKIPLLIELYHQDDAGALKLPTRVPVRLADRTGGSGLLQNLGDGTSELSLGDLAMFMITVSDNTATNLLIDRVGMEKVNATTRALGVPDVKLQRKMIRPRDSFAGQREHRDAVGGARRSWRRSRSASCRCRRSVAASCAGCSRSRKAARSRRRFRRRKGRVEAGDIEGVNTAWGSWTCRPAVTSWWAWSTTATPTRA